VRGSERTAAARLPPSSTSPSQARAFLAHVLRDWGDGKVADTARLLVSELVTNAVFHAHSPVEVRVRRGDEALRVEVRDGDPAPPLRCDPQPWSTTGRGVALVDSLAAAWGTERTGDGKIVWFELPLT
jgi:anti-sigma regulatory factor (Ser/Thr protein kinase)